MLTEDQLAKLRTVGKVSGAARELGLSMVKEGVKLYDVAQEVEGYIREHGCGLAFPCNISINEVAAHYTPSCNDKRVFELGDVVKVDCGGQLDGFVGDTAGTVEVGTNAYRDLVEISKTARNTVAEFIGDGIPLKEIGKAVEMTMKNAGFTDNEPLRPSDRALQPPCGALHPQLRQRVRRQDTVRDGRRRGALRHQRGGRGQERQARQHRPHSQGEEDRRPQGR